MMFPFTTAERKVLGVAAPTQAPLNWIYPVPPKPLWPPAPPDRLRQSALSCRLSRLIGHAGWRLASHRDGSKDWEQRAISHALRS